MKAARAVRPRPSAIGYQVKIVLHSAASITAVAERLRIRGGAWRGLSRRLSRRSALATTRMDDPDIATAATSGVTWPMIAIGTAMTL